ncbi:MAG: hypothetical protein ABL984_16505 [Pyrinomonadaceae bacterium]
MYPRSKFQEVLLEIRQEMAREADFDVDLFAEIVRTGSGPRDARIHSIADQPPGDRTRPVTAKRSAD